MKLRNYFLMAVIALCSQACSDDENTPDDPTPSLAEEIAGSYEGILRQSVQGSSQGKAELTLTIEAEEDGTATVTVPALGSGAMSMGAMTITGVEVEKNGTSYTLTKESFEVTAGQVNVTGSLSGTINSNGEAQITFPIKPGAMPFEIECKFVSATTPAAKVADEYAGHYSMSVMGSEQGSGDMTIVITEQSDGKVTLTVPGLGMGSMTMEDIVIPDVTVTASADGYTIVETSYSVAQTSFTVTGTVSGTISKEGDAEIVAVARPGAMPMDITINFSTEEEVAQE